MAYSAISFESSIPPNNLNPLNFRPLKRADIAFTELSCTYARSAATDFSDIFYIEVISFIAQRSREKNSLYIFAWAFDIWVSIMVSPFSLSRYYHRFL